MRNVWTALILMTCASIAPAGELDDLLRQVQESQIHERQADEERKARFLTDKNQQQNLLNETKTALAKAEAESKTLRERFAANETSLKELSAQLKSNSGDLGTLFTTVREFSGKLSADLRDSLVSAQFPGRAEALEPLVNGKEIPDIRQLENLWASLLQEMIESGRVARFPGSFSDTKGQQREADIYRIGVFSALGDDKYLAYDPKTGRLAELPNQPDGEYLSLARNLGAGKDHFVKVAVDPSRGSVLDLDAKSPPGLAWLPKGLRGFLANEVDVAIFGLLLLSSIWAVAVAIERWLCFRRVDVGKYPNRAALETDLTRHLTVVGTVAANAPYVGLLGTVLGIMMTFHKMGTEKNAMDVHSIMIGLSTALKATAIGLMVAIPCVVLNNLLRRRIRVLVTAYEVRNGS